MKRQHFFQFFFVRKTRNTGLSTMEIMIAIVILAVAFVPLYDILMGSRSDSVRSEDMDVMNRLVQGVLDEICGKPYQQIYQTGNSAGLDTEFDIPEDWYALSKIQFFEYVDSEQILDMAIEAKGKLGFDPSGSGTLDKSFTMIQVKVTWKEKALGSTRPKEIVLATIKSSPFPL